MGFDCIVALALVTDQAAGDVLVVAVQVVERIDKVDLPGTRMMNRQDRGLWLCLHRPYHPYKYGHDHRSQKVTTQMQVKEAFSS
jgi:hypothetical protein